MSTKLYNDNGKWISETVEISVEEFDSITETHEFSEEYQKKKQKILKEMKQREHIKAKKQVYKVAAAMTFALVVPVSAYAASTHADFFDSMFGNSTKGNIEAHDVEIEGNDGLVTVTVPGREYVSVDQEQAEQLIGDKTSDEAIVRQLGEHTLTIESVVYDKHAAFVSFTLERAGGVTMLAGDDSTNQSKGAYFTDESDYYFWVSGEKDINAGGCIYIDLEKSTSEKLYCYDYIVLTSALPKDAGIQMDIQRRPCIMNEREVEYSEDDIISETILLSDKGQIPTIEYTSESGGYLEISPVSLWLDMSKGLGLSYSPDRNVHSEAYDPGNIKCIEIKYKDGSSYLVEDSDQNINNTGYECGTLHAELGIVFNRLVDTDEIESIMVNGVKYTKK